MMVFSKVHNWQGEPAVKQIRVFTTDEVKKRFTTAMLERIEAYGIEDASDNNIGAIYKLRAIKNINKNWTAVIRCGFTSNLLYEDSKKYNTPEEAFDACKHALSESLKLSGVIDI